VTSFHRVNPPHGCVVAGARWRYGPVGRHGRDPIPRPYDKPSGAA
jgi:hypothetical protein